MMRSLFILLVMGLFVLISLPLLLPVAMGGVFAVLLFPGLQWLEKRKCPPSVSAGALTFGTTLLFLLPATFLFFLGAKAGWQKLGGFKKGSLGEGGHYIKNFVNASDFQELLDRMTRWLPISREDLTGTTEDFAKTIGLKIADWLAAFFSHLPSMTLGLVIMILKDGRILALFVRRHSFFPVEQTDTLFTSFTSLCRSVILASVISGLFQSSVFALAALVSGLDNILLIWLVVFLTSFIPLIGSMPVTFGVAVYELFVSSQTLGITLLIVAFGVSLGDNLIRPWVLKGASNLHPLLAFVAAFGGVQVLGVTGIFIGPIVAGLLVATVQALITTKPNTA
jgi:predicted PurR-regulated permease PerM